MGLEPIRRLLGAIVAFTCMAAGVIGLVYLVGSRPEPVLHIASTRALEVDTSVITPATAVWPVAGHGTVRPKHQVNIVPQVTGKLVYMHADLAEGKIIPAGELLFEIDSTVYEARVRQAKAEVRQLNGVLARHREDSKSLAMRVEVAKRVLAIEEDNYKTTLALYTDDNVGTSQQVAADESRYLGQKDVVLQLESRLAMIPHLIDETSAQLEAAQARLDQANFDLEGTKLHCPFEARVEGVSVYTSQVVTAHLSIATLTDMEAFELAVGVDPRELRWLEEAAKPEYLERNDGNGADVIVSSSFRGRDYTWRGFVTRFERVDEATRTARMVIEVEKGDLTSREADGYDDRMSLSLGMFCKAELPGRQLEDALVVPRHAIYENKYVYVFVGDDDGSESGAGRLVRRSVPMLRSVPGGVLVAYADSGADGGICEVKPYDQVVVSRLNKPVDGMSVLLKGSSLASSSSASESEDVASDISTPANGGRILANLTLAAGAR